MKELLKNYLSTMLFIIIWYLFYVNNNYYESFFVKDIFIFGFDFNTINIFHFIIIAYAILLIPFYLLEKNKSKARIVLNYFYKKIKNPEIKIEKEEKNSILAWIVKLFFTPMMILWLTNNSINIINKLDWISKEYYLFFDNFIYIFNNYIFLIILTLIIFIDLIFFTLWYMFESKYLKNKIKSVEPTILWWTVALICYPPFNISIENIFWWYSTNVPIFENFYIHLFLNILLLIFFWIYSRASFSLWLKASNLTNRWIITKWPYKFVRHPAYICKNISWFIWALPIIIINIKEFNIKMLIIISLSIIVWAYIYYLRAITEERHLEMDNDYINYQKKVPYKFIPWIY